MKIDVTYNSKLRIDLSKISSKNLLENGLVWFAHKFAKLVTKTSSKVQMSKIYNKAINSLIYENKYGKAVNKEI